VAARMFLVLGSAALYAAALQTSAGPLLGWLALAPFLAACATAAPRAAFGLGLLLGLATTLGVAWWFPGLVERYFGLRPSLGWLALAIVGITADGLPFAVFGAWLAWAARRGRLTPLGAGAAFALCELARAQLNPFGLLGYSLAGTPFAQAADLAGPWGLGALLAAASAALAAQQAPVLARGRPRRALAGVALAALAVLAYGEVRLAQEFGNGEPLRVAAVQGAIARRLHWDRSTADANLARYLALNREAADARATLIFWPEYAVDFYLSEETLAVARLLDGVHAAGADVVFGASRWERSGRAARYFNSVYSIDGRGLLHTAVYDKQRLVPFAESAPLGDWLRADSTLYAAGRAPRLVETRSARVGAFLCAEALYPEVARGLARAGAELLANPSNDYWFGAPQAAAEQLTAATFRAIENRRYLVRATATGVSAIVDAHGRVTARSRGDGPEVVAAELRRCSAVTLYQRVGDLGVALACLLTLGLTSRTRGGTI
jgi:apolipoprotein N-acyltransferase